MKFVPLALFFASVPLCFFVPLRIARERLIREYGVLAAVAAIWGCRDAFLAVEWFRGLYPWAWHIFYGHAFPDACHFALDAALSLACFQQMGRRTKDLFPTGLIILLATCALVGVFVTWMVPTPGLFTRDFQVIRYGRAWCGTFLALSLAFFSRRFTSIGTPSSAAFDQAGIACVLFVGTFIANTLASMKGLAERQAGGILLELVCVGCFAGWSLLLTAERERSGGEPLRQAARAMGA